MTSAQFDHETAERLNRIATNPNPRLEWAVTRFVRRSIAWGRNLDRAAAVDSGRNVLAFIGVGAVLAYMGTMPPYLVPLATGIFGGAWYLDYMRHF